MLNWIIKSTRYNVAQVAVIAMSVVRYARSTAVRRIENRKLSLNPRRLRIKLNTNKSVEAAKCEKYELTMAGQRSQAIFN